MTDYKEAKEKRKQILEKIQRRRAVIYREFDKKMKKKAQEQEKLQKFESC